MKPQVVNNVKVKDKATKIEIPFGLSQEECPICWNDLHLHQIARDRVPATPGQKATNTSVDPSNICSKRTMNETVTF
jgi:hypothetical protein